MSKSDNDIIFELLREIVAARVPAGNAPKRIFVEPGLLDRIRRAETNYEDVKGKAATAFYGVPLHAYNNDPRGLVTLEMADGSMIHWRANGKVVRIASPPWAL